MKALIDFLKQDGNASKTGMLYGALCLVFILGVLTLCSILVVWAIQGTLTADKAKALIEVAKEPAQGTGIMTILYNLERWSKGKQRTSADEAGKGDPDVN